MLLDMFGAPSVEVIAAVLMPILYAALVAAFGALARDLCHSRPSHTRHLVGDRDSGRWTAGPGGSGAETPATHRELIWSALETKRYQRQRAAPDAGG